MRSIFGFIYRLYLAVRSRFYVFYYSSVYGVEFGKGVRINSRLLIHGPGKVIVGDGTKFSSRRAVNELCTTSRDAVLKIGKGCLLNGVIISCAKSVTIGDRCIIAEAYIRDTSSHGINPSVRHVLSSAKVASVELCENVWIDSHSHVMPGVTIRKNTVVGVNSVVTKDLPPNIFAAGCPTKVISELDDGGQASDIVENSGDAASKDIINHYNKAAQNRDERLKTPFMNISKFNHIVRNQIIRNFLSCFAPFEHGIDIGTGTGVWAEVLTEYCSSVVGIDFAEENIKIASNNAQSLSLVDRLSYSLGNAQTLEGIADNNFDIVVQISVLQHLADKNKCLRRINEILRKNGHLLLLVHNRDCIYNRNLRNQRKNNRQVSINEYTSLSEIMELVNNAGFEIKDVRLSWLFLNDFLFVGVNKRFLKPFAFIRYGLFYVFLTMDKILNRFKFLNPLFREIVLIAEKKDN